MIETMSKAIGIGEYLFTRLQQLGVGSIHGVPGDYNLKLLDYVEPLGLTWVGNANELNAGYAADGYARIKGIGALVTTYGVGELSAINAIAGAFTERAAVVHIVGTPPRDSQESRRNIHHTLGDGDYRHFAEMAKHVTIAQTNLIDPRTAPKQIDTILEQCLLHSRPVYIELPVDMVTIEVAADELPDKIQVSQTPTTPAHQTAVSEIIGRVYAAKDPVILVDGGTRSLAIRTVLQQLIATTKWPTFTSASGKGLIDMTVPNVHGIYQGVSADQPTQNLFKSSDLVLCFGPHHSTTNSYSLTAIPNEQVTIYFDHGGIKISGKYYRDISAKLILDDIMTSLDISKSKANSNTSDLAHDENLSFIDIEDGKAIKQDQAWRLLGSFIREGDIVLGETGTAGYGVREMALPKNTTLFTPTTWLSIGYMLPAAQGAALAQRELVASKEYGHFRGRTILFIGDGSFQMTAQELGTIIRHKLDVVVFLINNDGYTIERCIHGLRQSYNDIPRWRYLDAPLFFGAPQGTYTASARNYGELRKALHSVQLGDKPGLRMVEVVMEREDAPFGPLLNVLNDRIKEL